MQGLRPLVLGLTLLLPAAPDATSAPSVAAAGTSAAPSPTVPAVRRQLWRFYDAVLVDGVAPQYPRRARRQGAEGRVVIQVLIHVDGTVSDPVVLYSDAPGYGFEEAILAVLPHWRYAAAVENRRPVEVYSTIVIQFALDDPNPPPAD